MNNKLPILAIESSGDLCSVAVMIKENVYTVNSLLKKHVHSEKLLPMVETTLKQMDLTLSDIGHIAVSNGPGSFTGLRIGMSVVKGLAAGARLPVVQVPTFEAMALQISAFLPENSEFIIANNVNVTELYVAAYKNAGERPEEIKALQVIEKKKFEEFSGEIPQIFGNYNKKKGNISSPSAEFVAKWSYFFGEDLLTYDIDYIEPYYLKNFIAKEQK